MEATAPSEAAEKRREYQRRYRAAHPERIREYRRRFKERHPERAREIGRAANRAWLLRHREKHLEYVRRYNAKHPEKVREAGRRYRAKRTLLDPGWAKRRAAEAFARLKQDPVRYAQEKAKRLAQWHARKQRDPDFATKELARREYKRRRYHEVYKKDPEKMARKATSERAWASKRRQARMANVRWTESTWFRDWERLARQEPRHT